MPLAVGLKGIVSHQALLRAVELGAVGGSHQCLALIQIPEAELIDDAMEIAIYGLLLLIVGVEPAACAQIYVVRSNAADVACLKVGVEHAIGVDVATPGGAVDGNSHMVPVIVGK